MHETGIAVIPDIASDRILPELGPLLSFEVKEAVC
jgi:hypothetical protein